MFDLNINFSNTSKHPEKMSPYKRKHSGRSKSVTVQNNALFVGILHRGNLMPDCNNKLYIFMSLWDFARVE